MMVITMPPSMPHNCSSRATSLRLNSLEGHSRLDHRAQYGWTTGYRKLVAPLAPVTQNLQAAGALGTAKFRIQAPAGHSTVVI